MTDSHSRTNADHSAAAAEDGLVSWHMNTMPFVAQTKASLFTRASSRSRTAAGLDQITDAAYSVRRSYNDAEALFQQWATAPVEVERAVGYILAEVTVEEALTVWEPQFAVAPTETAAALDALAGLLAHQ